MKKRYRKFLAALTSLTLISTSGLLLPVNAEDFATEEQVVVSDATEEKIIEIDGLRYKETDDFMFLYGVVDTSVTSITIPAVVNGKPVSVDMSEEGDCDEWINSFAVCDKLESFLVDEDNMSLCSVDGILFSKDMTTLICCPKTKTGEYTLPETVQYITKAAFANCLGITKITLPKSIIKIGDCAFQGCTNLKEIVNPAPFKNMNAITACYSLERVELAENLEFDSFILSICPSLKELVIPDSTKVSNLIHFQACGLPTLDLSPIQITNENFRSVSVESCDAKELILPKTGKMQQLRLSDCDALQKVEVPEENYFIRGIKVADCPVLRCMRFLNLTFRTGEVLGMSQLEGATVEENSNVAFYTDSESLQATAEKLGIPWYPLSQEYLLYGDVNQDGKVDLMDCITLSKVNCNLIELSETQQKAADCDANGTVDDNDEAILIQYVIMLISDLPYIEA